MRPFLVLAAAVAARSSIAAAARRRLQGCGSATVCLVAHYDFEDAAAKERSDATLDGEVLGTSATADASSKS